jgi:hypothetical protein
MGITKEIAYFNAFYLKSEDSNKQWHIEESRIKGGFNNTSVDFGVRAFLVDENHANERRKNAIIFSGIYNSKTGVNNLNQFSIGANNTRAVDNANGSIQKLHAEDTALIVFQEDKILQAPVDKDFIFTAEGVPLSTTSKTFIGTFIPYSGRYGIGTVPESFAVKGNRKYFADNKRNAVLRLSRDGLTEISFYGMRDYFKDNLKNNERFKAIGMYDNVHDQYVLHLDDELGGTNQTIAFDESSIGWPSFYTYYPEAGCTLNNVFYTFKKTNIWKHHSSTNYNKFYEETADTSHVELVLNADVSFIKTFHTLNYEGTTGWDASNIKTDLDDANFTDQAKNIDKYSDTFDYELPGATIFNKKEGKYYAILKNTNDGKNASLAKSKEILFGDSLSGIRGAYLNLKLSTTAGITSKNELFAVSAEIVKSS